MGCKNQLGLRKRYVVRVDGCISQRWNEVWVSLMEKSGWLKLVEDVKIVERTSRCAKERQEQSNKGSDGERNDNGSHLLWGTKEGLQCQRKHCLSWSCEQC